MSTINGNRGRLRHGQGSQIFWGTLSVLFAAGACYFFWQNRDNDLSARKWKDDVNLLQLENQQLKAQIDKLQSNMAQFDILLKNRDERLKEQATSLQQVTQKTQQLDAEKQETERQRQSRLEAIEKIRQSFQELANGKEIVLVKRQDAPALRIVNTSLFVPGEMALKADAQELLRKVVAIVSPQLKDYSLRVESFTDNDPITGPLKTKYPSNYELSAARAAAVGRFLVSDAKVPPEHLIIVGRGENYPVASNDTKEGKAQNRRLEILLEPVDLTAATP